ncbi:MAG: hypothetical protein J7M29_00235 [Verrucomicrobia bacterium]|nr:hypothetical protein [Verrucomicrobiota bacterium]
MHRKILNWIGALALAAAAWQARAFSLLGPFDTWQTQIHGFQLSQDIGGPMNLGEEYRVNVPMIVYAFDESFLSYYGEKGAEEVEKAIQVFNDLPPFSEMSADLHEYPLISRRFNYRAGALNLLDLKSWALGVLLEHLGVAPAERYVWCLYNYIAPPQGPIYTVVQRNFDPITFEPSSYVNGVLYTYRNVLISQNPEIHEAVEIPVDPLKPTVTSVSALNMGGGTVDAPGAVIISSPGLFFTGLTRDDVAALRYLYRFGNYNVENIISNAVLAPMGAKEENTLLTSESGGSPWGPPAYTNAVGGTNVIGGGTNGLAPVLTGIRPGIDKLQFVRVDYDSMLGTWVPVTNRYTDYIITNSALYKQVVDRVLSAGPDLLFAAGDLGVDTAGQPVLYTVVSNIFVNNDALNGNTALAGPGTIQPPFTITFSKIGRAWINAGGGEQDAFLALWWGSFDGTTNEPVAYPKGASIKAIEELILSGRADQEDVNPWLPPPALLTGGGAAGGGYGDQQQGNFGTGGATGVIGAGGGTTP